MGRSFRSMLAACLAAAALAASACADESAKAPCKGRVTDLNGAAVSGALVRSYEVLFDGGAYSLIVTGEATTGADGAFEFGATSQSPGHSAAGVVASKEGLALAWEDWDYNNHPISLVMGQPKTLAGKVVDANGAAIAGAEVQAFVASGQMPRPRWLPGLPPLDLLVAKADEQGAFAFKNIPAGATANFIASAPGKARMLTSTWKTRLDMRGEFPVDKTDIEIALPDEARIEGVVTDKTTGKPAAGQVVACRLKKSAIGYEGVEAAAKDDGAFAFGNLAPGVYVVEPLAKGEEGKLTAAPVLVNAEIGQTTGGVKVEIAPEVEAQVQVVDAQDGKPLAQAGVEIDEPQTAAGETDQDGIVRFTLPQGQYKVAKIYKAGYRTAELDATFDVQSTDSRLVLKLESMPAIKGIARDEAGNPVAGAQVWIVPIGLDVDLVTDEQGAFKGQWDPDAWGTNLPQVFVVARSEEKGLAGTVEVASPDRPVEVLMKKGAELAVHLVDAQGKPIEGAPVTAIALLGDMAMTVGQTTCFTDKEGRWVWKALPTGFDYVVDAVAPEFGRRRSTVTLTEAAIDKETVVEIGLSAADLSVTGTVVDADGKPVAKASVTVRGEGQPARGATSDVEGKFKIEGLVAGDITVSAYQQEQDVQGKADSKAGARDVKITVTPRPKAGTTAVAQEAPSLVGKAIPDTKDLGIDTAVNSSVDKMILLCFFDLNQRASRHLVSELGKIAADTGKRGIVVIGVDTSGMDASARQAVMDKLAVRFPIGAATESEKTLAKWGVQGQPWLVLTSRTHEVKAEGFTLDQLDLAIEGKVTKPKAVAPPPGPTWY